MQLMHAWASLAMLFLKLIKSHTPSSTSSSTFSSSEAGSAGGKTQHLQHVRLYAGGPAVVRMSELWAQYHSSALKIIPGTRWHGLRKQGRSGVLFA